MKVGVRFLSVLGLSTATVLARLGETREETTKRYGAPNRQERSRWDGKPEAWYKSEGFTIVVSFAENDVTRSGKNVAGRSIKEQFISNQKISEAQLAALLNTNLGSNSWKKVENEWYDKNLMPTWRSTNNTHIAHLFEHDSGTDSLIVRWEDAAPPPKGF